MRNPASPASRAYKADRLDEMRAYTLLYAIRQLTSSGKSFTLWQSTRGNWSASVQMGPSYHETHGWDSPSTCLRALIDQVEGK